VDNLALLRENPGLLYLKIATWMRRDIASGVLARGQRLPSLEDLAGKFGVSLVTIRQAVALLEQDRLLKRYQGRGTFVSDDPKVGRWLTLRSDMSSLLHHLEGKEPRLLATPDDGRGMPSLAPDEGRLAPAYRSMRRVHYSGEVAYALIDIFLDRRIYERAPATFDRKMIISTLAKLKGIKIERVRQTVSFSTADPETAQHLSCPVNGPIGDVRRVITDESGTAIYVGETKYRGDFVKLEFNLEA
jgi:GntR family transcriptional regulator